jgi:hypothetical protein
VDGGSGKCVGGGRMSLLCLCLASPSVTGFAPFMEKSDMTQDE